MKVLKYPTSNECLIIFGQIVDLVAPFDLHVLYINIDPV